MYRKVQQHRTAMMVSKDLQRGLAVSCWGHNRYSRRTCSRNARYLMLSCLLVIVHRLLISSPNSLSTRLPESAYDLGKGPTFDLWLNRCEEGIFCLKQHPESLTKTSLRCWKSCLDPTYQCLPCATSLRELKATMSLLVTKSGWLADVRR